MMNLRETIAAYGLLNARSKRYGQHFLTNPSILNRIARLATPDALPVVEIGPGPGGLTRALIDTHTHHIHAIEIDPKCIEALKPLTCNRLSIIQKDALNVCTDDLIQGSYRIVGNLPYNVGTPLIVKWLTQTRNALSLTVMVQKEVALRMVAKPGTKSYGRLSILVQLLGHPKIHATLAPGAFLPPPKVESSVVQIDIRQDRDFERISALEELTQRIFSKRRKMIRGVLGDIPGISPTRRGETFSPEEVWNLLNHI